MTSHGEANAISERELSDDESIYLPRSIELFGLQLMRIPLAYWLRDEPMILPRNLSFFNRSKAESPTENPFTNTKRFRVLKKSELKDNYDLNRLYLELLIGTSGWRNTDQLLSSLTIVKVAMENANGEGLNDKNVTFYINYLCQAPVGEDDDRTAIVRRAYNEQSGCFSLEGRNLSTKALPP
ncbi:unnamed protein product [Arabis nemorensis]|uniref:Uncharacterized protein n=1 Tax=Arabis nemorensis TaxID=586526 RepID=A0A565C704_9BRAS|nr:unnamed protein product [Arabis nemorensis]